MWGMTFEKSLQMFAPREARKRAEAEARADERQKVRAELEAYSVWYVEKWSPIVGEDRAKAEAWNILVAARRVTEQRSPESPK